MSGIAGILHLDGSPLDRTAFAEIKRLPAAHALTVAAGSLTIDRYWSLPTGGRIRYRDARDYTDHFAQLLTEATGDRLRGETAGMLMSGGVDSTPVATTASRLPCAPGLRGYTFVYDRLMPDDERHVAGLAAGAIGMPIEFWPTDDYPLFGRCDEEACRKPERYHWPLEAVTLDLYRHIAASHRVVLTGQGGDPLSYFGSLLNTPRFHTLLGGPPVCRPASSRTRSAAADSRRFAAIQSRRTAAMAVRRPTSPGGRWTGWAIT